MRPSRAKGPRQLKALSLAAVLVASILLVAPAMGAFGLLDQFGRTGTGPGTIGPQAPAIAVDPDGRVYVADVKDGRIEAFTNGGAPDGGWGGHEELTGVAAAPDGTIVVSDAAGIRRFAIDGTELETLSDLSPVAGIAVGDDGTVYAADAANHRVVEIGGEQIASLEEPVAIAVLGRRVYVTNAADGRVHAFTPRGTSSWHVGSPSGIAVAPGGSLFVADIEQNHVLQQRADGETIATFGGVNVPRGVATDCLGRVYVVDNSALRVRVYGEAGPPPPCPERVAATPTPAPQQEVLGEVAKSEPAPLLGVRARGSAVSGTVRVGTGGRLHPLSDGELIPLGSTIDATNGHVKLEFESAPGADRAKYGALMDGEFYDGAFKIEQSRSDGLVDIKLLDDGAPAASKSLARAAAKRKKLKVWGNARGRFRTVGRNGAATVRGTGWLTEERDEGTFFRVREGVVEVREFFSGRRIVLEAGESYLARPQCVSKRNFRIRLRTRDGGAVRRARVLVNGKRVKVRRGRRLTAPVDLRGIPGGRVTVRIRLVTIDGRVITGRRVYNTCSPEPRRPSRPPEL